MTKEIARFRERLQREVGPIDRIILYGSNARGEAREDSDVDLIVVSDGFHDKRPIDRSVLARSLWPAEIPADILCYTREEFARLQNQVSIVSHALEEGFEVTG